MSEPFPNPAFFFPFPRRQVIFMALSSHPLHRLLPLPEDFAKQRQRRQRVFRLIPPGDGKPDRKRRGSRKQPNQRSGTFGNDALPSGLCRRSMHGGAHPDEFRTPVCTYVHPQEDGCGGQQPGG